MEHMMKLRSGERGQALLLVTLSLFAMCGLLGLAVDLGWSYFIQKSAQNAADSAALSAAYQALCTSPTSCGSAPGETVPITCGNVTCQQSAPCASGTSNNLSYGCSFGQQNGFMPTGDGGRQNVMIAADLGPVIRYQDKTIVPICAPSSGVLVGCIEYRVTVRAAEVIPQLFSAVLGNTTALPSARATAAVVQTLVNGSLITLDRENSLGPPGTPSPIAAPNGMVISGPLPSPVPLVNGGPIFVPSFVSTTGMGGTNTFSILPDGPQFLDPLRGYGQPPIPTTDPDGQCGKSLCTYAVINADFSGTGGIYQCLPGVPVCQISLSAPPFGKGGAPLPSGNYFPASLTATNCNGNTCFPAFGGGQLTISHNTVAFNDPATSFGYYFFYGGLNVAGGKTFMGPGEYVFVGAGPPVGTGDSLSTSGTAEIDGAGAIMIFTGASGAFTGTPFIAVGPADLYPNLLTQINSSANLVSMAEGGQLAFGPVSLSTGPAGNVSGIDPSSSALPLNLVPFGGIVMWQDQANSAIDYTTPANTPAYLPGSGYVDIYNCGTQTMATPCRKNPPLPNSNSPGLNVQTSNTLGFTGTIYQPRGAWINVGTGILSGFLQVITGSVAGSGNPMTLTPLPANLANLRLRRRVVTLIE
jgi:hypothetical protein